MPTLLEIAKDSATQIERAIIRTITERTPIMQMLPFTTVDGLQYQYFIEKSLPTVAARNIGGTYTANSGVRTPVTERLCIFGGEVKIDNFEVYQGGQLRDVKSEQYRMKARAMAIQFSNEFFNGDGDLNPASFDGIKKRLSGSSQVINAGTGGATLTLDMLDQLYDTVVGGPDAIFLNKTLARKIYALARDHTGRPLIDTDTDSFGKRVTTYNGVPMHIVERDDNASTLLDFTEDNGSGNPNTASIYAIKFGDDYVAGLKGKGTSLDVKDFGELQASPQHMGRVEAYWGLVLKHPRSAARLVHVNNA